MSHLAYQKVRIATAKGKVAPVVAVGKVARLPFQVEQVLALLQGSQQVLLGLGVFVRRYGL